LTNKAVPAYPYFEDKNYVESLSNEKAGPFSRYLTTTDFNSPQANKDSINFKKNDMTGRFEMGSTIVLIFEANNDTHLNVHEGKKLRVGEQIVSH
jgi:phosphatidylserine decarboxylase